MTKLRFRSSSIILAFVLLLLLSLYVNAQDEEITAVTLVSYNVVPLDNAVKIVWITGTEPDTAGFRIKRGAPEGPFETLDFLGDDSSGIIYSQGGVSEGASYERIDNTVLNGQTFTYILIEIENSGAEVEPENARRTVTVGIPPTNTPVSVIAPGAGTSATATPPVGATAVATSPGSNPTAVSSQPTATRITFATVTPAARSTEASAPTAVPVTNNTTTNNVVGNPTARPTQPANDTADNGPLVASALAQAEETPQPSPTDAVGYPGASASDADPLAPTAYPGDQATATLAPTATGVAVIGNAPGYGGASNSGGSTAANSGSQSGNLFLWLGFIVALLIFFTGIVGSIILYTRKSG
jgi:hypothetical protein